MRLTRQTEIAIDILVACARSPDRVILTAEAAHKAHTSKDHAAHIVRLLLQSGFLFAERGRYGGIGLAMPAQEIPLGDVLRQVQPDLVRYSLEGRNDAYEAGTVHPVFAAIATVAETTFLDIMNRYSVADLAASRKVKFSAKTSNKAVPLPCNVCELMHRAVHLPQNGNQSEAGINGNVAVSSHG
ncbi:Rrf2 family transcriptional regulator [Ochrobactrum pecoris]|nr:Rrf2 family transcriptional regulator [Brucella pecoris]MBB4095689.1 Rrf2 family nitric oxide-sensitive transcriptional repressor [Brucella pecoris]NKW81797.1 Rrf2 family transcriptional regulator [Brucella pecoris]